MDVKHWRFVNNNDIVTKVPFWFMGYRHHGTEWYINYYGILEIIHIGKESKMHGEVVREQ